MRTIILLTISNLFMNLAWYGHLKFRNYPLWIAILVSWGIAFFEYIFQVPANRIGSYEWTVPQLKVLQECITLIVFTLVAFALFRSPVRWNYLVTLESKGHRRRPFCGGNRRSGRPDAGGRVRRRAPLQTRSACGGHGTFRN